MRRNRARGIRGLALLAASLLGLAAVAGGCGGSDEAEQPRQVGQADGLEVYEVASQGFSIGVPPDWRVVSVDEALPEAERKELARENPEFAPIMEAIGAENQPIKLFAFDPEVRDGFATNVNVLAGDLPGGVTAEEFISANKEDLERVLGLSREIESESVHLPSGAAEKLVYQLPVTTGGEQREVATRQYVTTRNGVGYIVTFSTLPQHSARYASTFDRIIRSLRLD